MIGSHHQRPDARPSGSQSSEDVIMRQVGVDDLELLFPNEALERDEVHRIVGERKMVIEPELLRAVDASRLHEGRDALPGIGRRFAIGERDGMASLLELTAQRHHRLGRAGQLPIAQEMQNFQGVLG